MLKLDLVLMRFIRQSISDAALGSLGTVYAWKHCQWMGCVALGLIYSIGILLIDPFDFKLMQKKCDVETISNEREIIPSENFS